MEENTKGYNDQEILLMALSGHISKSIKTSEGIIKGQLRLSLQQMQKNTGKTLRDIKALDEAQRDNYIMELSKIFFEKLNLDIKRRRNLKYDYLQIYERWKQFKRKDISEVDDNFSSEAPSDESNTDENSEIDESLVSDFDSLDLDGLF